MTMISGLILTARMLAVDFKVDNASTPENNTSIMMLQAKMLNCTLHILNCDRVVSNTYPL